MDIATGHEYGSTCTIDGGCCACTTMFHFDQQWSVYWDLAFNEVPCFRVHVQRLLFNLGSVLPLRRHNSAQPGETAVCAAVVTHSSRRVGLCFKVTQSDFR
jgi:hypothetical protein